jgi:hypothetical protein
VIFTLSLNRFDLKIQNNVGLGLLELHVCVFGNGLLKIALGYSRLDDYHVSLLRVSLLDEGV